MKKDETAKHFPIVGDGTGLSNTDNFYREEVQLALRNRGILLEGLRYPVTPVGMHYLLTHFDVPEVKAEDWSLEIVGLVSKPRTITLADIQKRPAVTMPVTLECAGNGRALLTPRPTTQPWFVEGVSTAEWTGTPLSPFLEEAGLSAAAVELVFTGLDQGVQGEVLQYYQRSLSISEARREEVMLVYLMNGEPLPPQHGFPIRLLVPGWYGMTHVKWLKRIEAAGQPFNGYQMIRSYRFAKSADDPGVPLRLIKVRALMIPPGIPDFLTRTRLLSRFSETFREGLGGRSDVTRVEVSLDGGQSWLLAHLGQKVSLHAWREWELDWQAITGNYTLCVRATDNEGNQQPVTQPWNFQGMANNMVQRVNVIVE
jgi:DMSO/TMAO reductase YedYZ molybdopterin-dependent catalytic subunit